MASNSLDEETSKKVIRQVEFYFSDSNLPRDNFLKKTLTESLDGMVSLALICSFTRMRNHLGLGELKPDDVPEDKLQAVAETLRNSTSLKISEDGKRVGRSTELPKPDELIEQLDVRTVSASPFEYNVKREDVEAFFTKFSQVTSVRLPRHVSDKRFFCGTALVEFSTEEDAEKILEQSFEFAGVKLELKPKKDFDAEREKELQEFENTHPKGKNNSSPEANYPKGLVVAFTLKKPSSEGSAEQIENDKPENGSTNGSTEDAELVSTENTTEEAEKNSEDAKDAELVSTENTTEEAEKNLEDANVVDKDEALVENTGGTKSEAESNEGEKKEEETPVEEPATENEKSKEKPTAASFKDNKDVVLREDLKSVFTKFGNIKYVDFTMGDESGYIRFEKPEAAQKARAAAVLADQGGVVVKNFVAVLEPVTGEAEKDYWTLVLSNQEKNRDSRGGNWGRGGKHNRGRKHGRSRDGDGSSGRPAKAQKV